MLYHFPYETAFLSRTRLSYINLPGLLSDAKRDRSARVSGFVNILLGEVCYLVFVRDGEPFHAARLSPAGREPVPLSEVLRLVAEQIGTGEAGHIGYYQASEAQLRAMLATLLNTPLPLDGFDPRFPDQLFPTLLERGASGVLELCDHRGFHYLVLEDGCYRWGFFSGREAGVSVADFMASVFAGGSQGLGVSLFPLLEELPVQAPPGLLQAYAELLAGVHRELTVDLGEEEVAELFAAGRDRVRPRHAEVDLVSVEGVPSSERVLSPAALAEAFSALLTEVLGEASNRDSIDPTDVLERAAGERRYVLLEQGLFHRLPWPVTM
jgi:hypothetical protein